MPVASCSADIGPFSTHSIASMAHGRYFAGKLMMMYDTVELGLS